MVSSISLCCTTTVCPSTFLRPGLSPRSAAGDQTPHTLLLSLHLPTRSILTHASSPDGRGTVRLGGSDGAVPIPPEAALLFGTEGSASSPPILDLLACEDRTLPCGEEWRTSLLLYGPNACVAFDLVHAATFGSGRTEHGRSLFTTPERPASIVRVRRCPGVATRWGDEGPPAVLALWDDGFMAYYSGLASFFDDPVELEYCRRAGDEEEVLSDPPVDFSFGRDGDDDTGMNFGAWCVFVLHRSGDVYGMGPVIVDGSNVASPDLLKRFAYLDTMTEEEDNTRSVAIEEKKESPAPLSSPSSATARLHHARRRQARALRRYLAEAYGLPESFPSPPPPVVSARRFRPLVPASSRSSASAISPDAVSHWPLRYVGPIVRGRTENSPRDESSEASPVARAVRIQVLACPPPATRATAPLTLLAVLREDGQVELYVIPRPAIACSRFAPENPDDALILDEEDVGSGASVAAASITFPSLPKNTAAKAVTMRMLAVDPIQGPTHGMLHVGTEKGVQCVRFDHMEDWIRSITMESRSTAGAFDSTGARPGHYQGDISSYPLLTVGSQGTLIGLVATGKDVAQGRVLFATTDDGGATAVNITAAAYLSAATNNVNDTYDSKSLTEDVATSADISASGSPLPAPFYSIVSPLLSQIKIARSSLSRVAGSSTPVSEAGPTTVAALLHQRRRLEAMALPVRDLAQQVALRRKVLAETAEELQDRLRAMGKMAEDARRRTAMSVERARVAEENRGKLANRTAAALTICRAMRPGDVATEAEKKMAEEVARWDQMASVWEEKVKDVERRVEGITMALDGVGPRGQEVLMEEIWRKRGECGAQTNKRVIDYEAHAQDLLRGMVAITKKDTASLAEFEEEVQELIEGLGLEKERLAPQKLALASV